MSMSWLLSGLRSALWRRSRGRRRTSARAHDLQVFGHCARVQSAAASGRLLRAAALPKQREQIAQTALAGLEIAALDAHYAHVVPSGHLPRVQPHDSLESLQRFEIERSDRAVNNERPEHF